MYCYISMISYIRTQCFHWHHFRKISVMPVYAKLRHPTPVKPLKEKTCSRDWSQGQAIVKMNWSVCSFGFEDNKTGWCYVFPDKYLQMIYNK